MKKGFATASIASLIFLLSCNLKPHYSRPEMEVPESYRFTPQNNEDYANLSWWQQFEDPILNGLIETALKNNQDLQATTAKVLEYYAKYQVVFSQFFPDIGAVGNADRIKLSEEINFFPIPPETPRSNNFYQLLMQLSYEIDFWGRIRNASEEARYEYLSQIDARNITILTLVSSVAKAYIQLQRLDNQLLISKETYGSRKESWDIAQLRFDAGLVSLMEVKQAESEAEAAQVQIKNFETLVAQQEDLLSLLMGAPPGPIARGKLLRENKLPPLIPAGLPSQLLENRPDILQAEKNMIAANARIGVAKAAFFPAINLTGYQGQRSSDFDTFFKESAGTFLWGLGAFEPLFTGGRLTGQLSEAQASFVEKAHTYQQTVLTAFREVSDALIAHQKAKEKYEIQQQQSAALEEYLRLANLRYFNGQNDYLTVVDSEKNLFQVQLDTVESAGEVFLTLIDLYKALGQGWDVEADYCSKCDDPSPILDALF